MTKIFGAQNTGLPHEIFSNASGNPSATLRTSATPGSSSWNMIGCGMSATLSGSHPFVDFVEDAGGRLCRLLEQSPTIRPNKRHATGEVVCGPARIACQGECHPTR